MRLHDCMADGLIRFYDSVNRSFTNTVLTGHTAAVNGLDLLITPNNNVFLLSGSDDMTVNVYELTYGNKLVKSIPVGVAVRALRLVKGN